MQEEALLKQLCSDSLQRTETGNLRHSRKEWTVIVKRLLSQLDTENVHHLLTVFNIEKSDPKISKPFI